MCDEDLWNFNEKSILINDFVVMNSVEKSRKNKYFHFFK